MSFWMGREHHVELKNATLLTSLSMLWFILIQNNQMERNGQTLVSRSGMEAEYELLLTSCLAVSRFSGCRCTLNVEVCRNEPDRILC